jgi:hypothetical protein
MYQRCTPEEKRRPIEELLFEQPPAPKPKEEANAQWETLLDQLPKLSLVE